MYPYFISFSISCLLCFLAEKEIGKKNKRKFLIISVLAVLIPSMLAAFRDYTIGTDVMVYGNNIFNSAIRSKNFFSFIISQKSNSIEILYLLMNFIISRFTTNPHWLYFLIELLIISLVYKGLYDNKDRVSMSLGLLVFYMLFFGETLNLLRQSIAIAIIFCGMKYILHKELKKFVIVVIVASLFHITAIFALSLYLLNFIFEKRKSLLIEIGIIFIILSLLYFSNTIINLCINTGILPVKFERYLSNQGYNVDLNPIIIRLPMIFVILLFYNNYIKKNENGRFFFYILIIELILAQLRIVSPSLYRVSIYFAFIKIYAYSSISKILTKKYNRIIVNAILIIYLFVICYYQTAIVRNNDIYPYTSSILGI